MRHWPRCAGRWTGVATMLAEYARRRERIVAGLRAIPGVTCTAPQGAFYVFPEYFGALQFRNAERHGRLEVSPRTRTRCRRSRRSLRRARVRAAFPTPRRWTASRKDCAASPASLAKARRSLRPAARLDPIFSPRPWGSLSLAPFFPEKSNLAEPIGEAWMTGEECRFANGPFVGQKLGEVWPTMPAEWTGALAARCGAFPLLD